MACSELAALLRKLDELQQFAPSDEGEHQIERLIERIRKHREQHGTCDYKPTAQ